MCIFYSKQKICNKVHFNLQLFIPPMKGHFVPANSETIRNINLTHLIISKKAAELIYQELFFHSQKSSSQYLNERKGVDGQSAVS